MATQQDVSFIDAASKLPTPPKGEAQLIACYGTPWEHNALWYAERMRQLTLPPRIAMQWKRNVIWVNKGCATAFQLAFDEIANKGLQTLIPEFNGTYNLRKERGGTKWSMHSFGAAIDLNASQDPMGDHKIDMPQEIITIFETCKFTWGGRWKRPDAMHFQWGGY